MHDVPAHPTQDTSIVAPVASAAAAAPRAVRNVAVDAYRGFVMFLMMAEVLQLAKVAAAYPGNWLINVLAYHQTHVAWAGASLHDLIQPSFSLLVGVALAYSFARRVAEDGFAKAFAHAAWRSLILIALGVFLRSLGRPQTNFTFEDTLTQIGLGYGFLFLLALRPARDQWLALAVILVAYWAAFALYPLPPAGFDYAAVGVPAGWPHLMTGFAAHWNKNSNLAWAFDVWFLNLFPRAAPFAFNGGGYATLSFIPTLATMVLGLIAGGVLRSGWRPSAKVRWLVAAGAAGLASGWLLGALGVCPVVKRIWTPSFTLWSGGCCFLILASAYHIIDVLGHRKWAFPLVVIGMNSIAAYVLTETLPRFIEESFRTHLGVEAFRVFGDAYVPLLLGAAVLAAEWLVLFWMYRRRIFLRI